MRGHVRTVLLVETRDEGEIQSATVNTVQLSSEWKRGRTKGQLFVGLQHLLLHLLDLGCEDNFCGCGRVNASSLDGDNNVALVFKEVVGVEGDDSGLIRLSDIGETMAKNDNVISIKSKMFIRACEWLT